MAGARQRRTAPRGSCAGASRGPTAAGSSKRSTSSGASAAKNRGDRLPARTELKEGEGGLRDVHDVQWVLEAGRGRPGHGRH